VGVHEIMGVREIWGRGDGGVHEIVGVKGSGGNEWEDVAGGSGRQNRAPRSVVDAYTIFLIVVEIMIFSHKKLFKLFMSFL
jgi:hypothetical protein